jgi:renalase
VTVRVAGAGVAGLSCARALVDGGAEVTVFDKGQAVGGRASTRQVPPPTFDLGAQCFVAQRFVAAVQRWTAAGVCAPWGGVHRRPRR